MNKILFTSAAVLAVSAPSFAANYDVQKGGDHLMQDTRRMEPEKATYVAPARQEVTPAPVQRVETPQPDPEPVAMEEEKNDFDNFTGFYAGADAGYSFSSYGDTDLDGFEPGVFAGYGFNYDVWD